MTSSPDDGSRLTAAQRVLRARCAAFALHARYDGATITAAARAASPAAVTYFERRVDPEGVLPVAERRRRAEAARKSYFAALALKSARARRRRAKSGGRS